MELTDLALKPWQCYLPLCCRLESEAPILNSKECYFMVPRTGYLLLTTAVVEQHFAVDLGKSIEDFWYFSCELPDAKKTPVILPWQYPMGVVLDLLNAQLPSDRNIYDCLPLNLTLCRFRAASDSCVEPVPMTGTTPLGYPVMPLPLKNMKKTGMLWVKSMMKGSIARQYGVSGLELPPDQEKILMQSISDNDPRVFYGQIHLVRRNVLAKAKRERAASSAVFKFHCQGKLIVHLVDSERFPTLGLALREYFPCCYDLKNEDCTATVRVPEKYARVFICGAQPPCSAPIKCLVEELCQIDMAVHVVVIPVASNAPRARPAPVIAEPEADDWSNPSAPATGRRMTRVGGGQTQSFSNASIDSIKQQSPKGTEHSMMSNSLSSPPQGNGDSSPDAAPQGNSSSANYPSPTQDANPSPTSEGQGPVASATPVETAKSEPQPEGAS